MSRPRVRLKRRPEDTAGLAGPPRSCGRAADAGRRVFWKGVPSGGRPGPSAAAHAIVRPRGEVGRSGVVWPGWGRRACARDHPQCTPSGIISRSGGRWGMDRGRGMDSTLSVGVRRRAIQTHVIVRPCLYKPRGRAAFFSDLFYWCCVASAEPNDACGNPPARNQNGPGVRACRVAGGPDAPNGSRIGLPREVGVKPLARSGYSWTGARRKGISITCGGAGARAHAAIRVRACPAPGGLAAVQMWAALPPGTDGGAGGPGWASQWCACVAHCASAAGVRACEGEGMASGTDITAYCKLIAWGMQSWTRHS